MGWAVSGRVGLALLLWVVATLSILLLWRGLKAVQLALKEPRLILLGPEPPSPAAPASPRPPAPGPRPPRATEPPPYPTLPGSTAPPPAYSSLFPESGAKGLPPV